MTNSRFDYYCSYCLLSLVAAALTIYAFLHHDYVGVVACLCGFSLCGLQKVLDWIDDKFYEPVAGPPLTRTEEERKEAECPGGQPI